ncbi:diaminopimelate decarboxylase [Parageobacillus thermantarcticus]|uniref:Diaminopimelate decarboxylase n=1 Tax=Parageobacillus thermantarcticus TaxID=186116 RepID=A0A1I0TAI2_9BACL|nr:diaminopimelate decarboxylase [Parageobacillus thermantarcticus]SFA48026.1 diaminopimelate decarboxylase [Parageobacillus thermantarcticus]
MFFHGTSRVNDKGHLEIGGVDTVDLAKEYGTPLYIYDVALIRARARAFKEAFQKHGVKAQVAYASKAFSSIAMVQLAEEEGLSLDVVSGGELYTALQAGFPPERIHFHGNNKSREELMMALESGIGCVVVDNFYELELLEQLSKQRGKTTAILIRVTPGVEAHTHDYILTGQEDSKFGFDLNNGQADEALRKALSSSFFSVLGIHCHIGSQIFETTGFVLAAQKIFQKIADWKETYGFVPAVVNLGGGFGIRYTSEDDPIPVSEYVEKIIEEVKKQVSEQNIPMPEIWIEPGRSLVGDAGTTIYSIGSQKVVPNVRHYVAVDGGMSDNIRPALYEAKYEAVLANRVLDEKNEIVSIAGKCCESGDMLIWDLPLPKANPGDYLAVFCTGAYGYSMANNYNRIPRPAVVFVENGEAQLVVKRETYEDLVRLDLPLKTKVK